MYSPSNFILTYFHLSPNIYIPTLKTLIAIHYTTKLSLCLLLSISMSHSDTVLQCSPKKYRMKERKAKKFKNFPTNFRQVIPLSLENRLIPFWHAFVVLCYRFKKRRKNTRKKQNENEEEKNIVSASGSRNGMKKSI